MVVWVIVTAIAVSYGWGMRGTLLGHGRGAMLPGALLGLCIAFMSGYPALADNWIILAGAGAAAMYYGGGMTYGETIGFVIKAKDPPGFSKGVTGLVIKGIMWFGVAAGYLGITVRVLCGGMYGLWELMLLAAMPVALWPLGVALFNRPHKPEKGKLPRIFFSVTRAESWGGHLLILAGLIVFAAVKGDVFTLIMTLFGALGGGLGWFLGIYFYYLTHFPLANGKYLFGSWQTGGYINGWKIMECVLGFVGGGMVALGFSVALPELGGGSFPVAAPGSISGLLSLILSTVWLAAVTALTVAARIKKKPGRLLTFTMQTVFASATLALIYAGSSLAAALTCGTVLLGVVTDKMCFEKLRKEDYPGLIYITAAAFALLTAVTAMIFVDGSLSLSVFLAIALGVYELFTLIFHYSPSRIKAAASQGFTKVFRSELSVDGYFILTIVIFLISFYTLI